MTATLPALIALSSGGISFGLAALVLAGSALAKRLRERAEPRSPWRPGQAFGGLVLLAIPFAFATFCALFGTSLLLAIGTPAPAFLFVSLAALVGLRGAIKSSSYGMDGCGRIFGIFGATYVAVWGLVAFQLTGGVAALGNWGLAGLTPVLAAAPFAGFFTKVAARRRTLWTFPKALVALSALLAVCYFPLEAGLGAAWLPDSAWLRFPLVGAGIGLLLMIPAFLRALSLNGAARKRQRRELPRNALLLICLMTTTGLSWALARTVTEMLQPSLRAESRELA